ncbi:hypothetical protein BA6E_102305 [Bacteroidales bacterium 6E]|nr:hypothetical protein BA6E_102305 [Bacteroidales bacterium 6E]
MKKSKFTEAQITFAIKQSATSYCITFPMPVKVTLNDGNKALN